MDSNLESFIDMSTGSSMSFSTASNIDFNAIISNLIGFGIGIIIVMAFYFLCSWMLYKKGNQPAWGFLVPFLNIYFLIKMVGKPDWWILLFMVPFVNIIMGIMLIHNISKSFGHRTGFTLGLIFLGPIFYPILAFGSSKYVGPAQA